MPDALIKVFIVEDSPVVTRILERLLHTDTGIQVVGTAVNGLDALAQIPKVQPQVICTDLCMAQMDGMQFIQRAMAECPCPILVISGVIHEEETIDQLKTLGVLDFLPKPKGQEDQLQAWSTQTLIQKIKIIAGVTVFTKPMRAQSPRLDVVCSSSRDLQSNVLPARIQMSSEAAQAQVNIVAFGISTGGPRTMQQILAQLPSNFPVPILCTQHISLGFLENHVAWLNSLCKLKVAIALPGILPQPGYVYYAPESAHLGLTASGRFWYDESPPLDNHRPSVTRMFEAVAQVYGAQSLAILMTGMGRDGATGLLSIAQAGGITAAQDEASSVVFGMPKEAIVLGAAQHILNVEAIPRFLWEWVIAPRLQAQSRPPQR